MLRIWESERPTVNIFETISIFQFASTNMCNKGNFDCFPSSLAVSMIWLQFQRFAWNWKLTVYRNYCVWWFWLTEDQSKLKKTRLFCQFWCQWSTSMSYYSTIKLPSFLVQSPNNALHFNCNFHLSTKFLSLFRFHSQGEVQHTQTKHPSQFHLLKFAWHIAIACIRSDNKRHRYKDWSFSCSHSISFVLFEQTVFICCV